MGDGVGEIFRKGLALVASGVWIIAGYSDILTTHYRAGYDTCIDNMTWNE
jgi:hypothetical protein